jgi:hypothetical protein
LLGIVGVQNVGAAKGARLADGQPAFDAFFVELGERKHSNNNHETKNASQKVVSVIEKK